MTAKEVKRRTDKVHVDMSEVIVNGGPLTAVARGVQEVNETLAIHAAWTEERFDTVEEKLGNLDLGQQAMLAEMTRMEGRLVVRLDIVETRMDQVETRMDRMETRILGEIDKLAVRMDKVISFAIKDEPNGTVDG